MLAPSLFLNGTGNHFFRSTYFTQILNNSLPLFFASFLLRIGNLILYVALGSHIGFKFNLFLRCKSSNFRGFEQEREGCRTAGRTFPEAP